MRARGEPTSGERWSIRQPAETDPQAETADSHCLGWVAAAASLLLHLSLLLILAAWLLPLAPRSAAPVINTTLGTERDADELRNSIEPDAADAAALESLTDQFFVVTPMNAAAAVESAADPIDAKLSGIMQAASARLAGGTGEGDGNVGFFGTEAVGRSFVFIVDCSGSMKGYRFSRARAELNRAVGDLTPRQEFFVIFYNHGALPMYQSGSRESLVVATRTAVHRARRWINNREAGGGTKPDEAIRLALEMEPDVIFLLSDGKFDRTARNVARENNKHGAIIHTIAFQHRGSEALLKGIATDNDGRYRFVE